ncbi:MAG: 2-amino-4-hydroxy-6-hydroxymethyldihydropteridine diphosphokinase [Edaphocola sp.]
MPDSNQLHTAYLLLGSNMGNRLEMLQRARAALEKEAGRIAKASGIYETASWGVEGLPAHLNQALAMETSLSPMELLAAIQLIESRLGRERIGKWGNRSIDIDIIYYDDWVVDTPTLTIPHPLMQQRNFVLAPLAAIAPHFLHPVLNLDNSYLFRHTTDKLAVNLVENP